MQNPYTEDIASSTSLITPLLVRIASFSVSEIRDSNFIMSTQFCVICSFIIIIIIFHRQYVEILLRFFSGRNFSVHTQHLIHRPLFTMKTSLDQLSLERFTIRILSRRGITPWR